MREQTVRVPIFNGYVEVKQSVYDKLVAEDKLEAFKAKYDPKNASPTQPLSYYTQGAARFPSTRNID